MMDVCFCCCDFHRYHTTVIEFLIPHFVTCSVGKVFSSKKTEFRFSFCQDYYELLFKTRRVLNFILNTLFAYEFMKAVTIDEHY